MMITLLLAWALAGDPVAEAGTAYREAQALIEAGKPEEAVELLRKALQLLGVESEQIKYRDETSRRRHSYYPYYEMARARLMQAEREPGIQGQRDFLADAVSRLGQSRHPHAPELLKEAQSRLDAVRKSISLEGTFAAVKTRIEVLGSGDKFEEAFKQLDIALQKFLGRKRELEEVRVALSEKRAAAVKRYEAMMSQRLADVTLMDAETAGDRIAPLLRPALLPAELSTKPGPTFQWLARFIALWERQAGDAPRAAQFPGARVIAEAEALDASALEALALNVPQGFRAARHLARAWRMAKLKDIATGREDEIDTATASAVATSSAAALAKAEEAASKLEKSVKDSLLIDVAAHRKDSEEVAKKIEAGAKERGRLTAPIVKAEQQLGDGEIIGDAAALEKLRNDLSELESDGEFGTLTPRLRARAFLAHGITEAVLAFLEGKTLEQATERARLTTWRAFGFDPKVDARWAGRVSPKLQKVFDKIRPQ